MQAPNVTSSGLPTKIFLLQTPFDLATIFALSCNLFECIWVIIDVLFRMPVANIAPSTSAVVPSRSCPQFMTVSANVYIQIPWQYTSFAVWRAKIRVLAIATTCETMEISLVVLTRRHIARYLENDGKHMIRKPCSL